MNKFSRIIIKRSQLNRLNEWALECAPMEAPALLVGTVEIKKDETSVAIVSNVYPMPNIEQSTVRFQVDPEEYYKIYLSAEKDGKQIVGIFHSHPMEPKPSDIDLTYMKLHGNIWVILSTTQKNDTLKAYQYLNDQLNKIKIEILE
ncbi:MAG: M67 family peptidase [Promethearchaeota archaeon]|nr:MAG: M67 family peptidase [Candidatus Lokiarchaeota archaeon]